MHTYPDSYTLDDSFFVVESSIASEINLFIQLGNVPMLSRRLLSLHARATHTSQRLYEKIGVGATPLRSYFDVTSISDIFPDPLFT